MKELYSLRKETIERIFGSAKENHGFRYTQMFGKARMEMKAGLTFACMNLKKLVKLKAKRGLLKEGSPRNSLISYIFRFLKKSGFGIQVSKPLCLQSEKSKYGFCISVQLYTAVPDIKRNPTQLNASASAVPDFFIFSWMGSKGAAHPVRPDNWFPNYT